MADPLRSVDVEIRAIRQRHAGVLTIQDRGHGDVAAIADRLGRIEPRLVPAD